MLQKLPTIRQHRGLLLLARLLLVSCSSFAQTALIAHRSHGGTGRTFRAGRSGHDFGIPPYRHDRWVEEKLVWLGGTRALYSGRWVKYNGQPPTARPATFRDTIDLRQKTGEQDLSRMLQQLRRWYPEATFVGFDEQKMRATWPGAK